MGTQQNSFQLNYADRNLTAVAENIYKIKALITIVKRAFLCDNN